MVELKHISLFGRLRLLTLIMLCTSAVSGCASDIDIIQSTATIRNVQLVNVDGNNIGDESLYLIYEIETSEPLSKLSGILQFRQNLHVSADNQYLELANGAQLNKNGKLSSLEFAEHEESSEAPFRYTVFVYRGLEHDHDGDVILNLLKDEYQKLELSIELRMYIGPSFARSKKIVLSREGFITLNTSFDPFLPTLVVTVLY